MTDKYFSVCSRDLKKMRYINYCGKTFKILEEMTKKKEKKKIKI